MNNKGLIERVVAILSRPKVEWPLIAAEPDTVGGIFSRYVVILAAIPAVMGFLKMSIIGINLPFAGTMRIGIGAGISGLVLGYLLSLLGVYLVALLVDALAPGFGGQKNRVQALKTVAYAYTASWIAGIGQIIPWLSFLILLAGGIYGIYLLYLGLPSTMKCPPEKAGGYTAVTIILALILGWVIGLAVATTTGMGFRMNAMSHSGYPTGVDSGSTSGDNVTFDKDSPLGKLQAIGQQAEIASKQMEAAQKSGDAKGQINAAQAMVAAALGGGAGKVEALTPDRLKTFVPETIGGMKRTDMSVERNGAMGMQVGEAHATYAADGGSSIHLDITDLGSVKGLMSFAGWAGAEQDHETDHSFDKTYKDGDRWVHEKWDSQSKDGEYGLVIADRFSISAKGSAKSLDDLKAAVTSVDLHALEALKNEGVAKN